MDDICPDCCGWGLHGFYPNTVKCKQCLGTGKQVWIDVTTKEQSSQGLREELEKYSGRVRIVKEREDA